MGTQMGGARLGTQMGGARLGTQMGGARLGTGYAAVSVAQYTVIELTSL